MRCSCSDPLCTTRVFVDPMNSTLTVERVEQDEIGPRTSQILLYLDPNLTVKLIRKLKETLLNFTEVEE